MEKNRKQDQLLLNKDDQDEGDAEKNAESHSNGNVPSLSHQYAVPIPWPYVPHHGGEQSPVLPRSYVGTQSPRPESISQWPQFAHQVQYGQPPRTYPHSAVPFWLPKQPGYPLPPPNGPSPLQPHVVVGATDGSGGASTKNQPRVPNSYYHVGYPYPGFPGSCDPSYWWNQAQIPQPQCTYPFPGSSPLASEPSCSTALAQAVGEGIIRPPAKLSDKHQQLWDAQSAENLQLRCAVNHLQSEVSDCKSRIARLEAEVSAVKAVSEGTNTQVSGAAVKPSKRGSPKRLVPSDDAVYPPPLRARGRRPAAPTVCNGQQIDTKSHLFEKVILQKVENKEKMLDLIANVEKGNHASHVIRHSDQGNNGTSSPMPAAPYQFQQKLLGILSANQSSAPLEMKETDIKANNCKTTYPIISQNIPWSYINTSDFEGNVPHTCHDDLYNGSIAIAKGEDVIPGWRSVKQEDTAERSEDAMLGSGSNENKEIMGDDNSSSGDEQIPQTNNEGGINVKTEGTSNTPPLGLVKS